MESLATPLVSKVPASLVPRLLAPCCRSCRTDYKSPAQLVSLCVCEIGDALLHGSYSLPSLHAIEHHSHTLIPRGRRRIRSWRSRHWASRPPCSAAVTHVRPGHVECCRFRICKPDEEMLAAASRTQEQTKIRGEMKALTVKGGGGARRKMGISYTTDKLNQVNLPQCFPGDGDGLSRQSAKLS